MNTEASSSYQTGSRKRARSPLCPPIVMDYRPYTGRQLAHAVTSHKSQWDLYYRNNTVNGYKDRHYLMREFCELSEAIMEAKRAEDEQEPMQRNEAAAAAEATPLKVGRAPISWMEVGCGVGNAMLPVFEEYGRLTAWERLVGFDISSVAITLLQAKQASLTPSSLREKMQVCVLDPTESDVADCPFFEKLHVEAAPVAVRNPVRFVSMVFVLCSIPVPSHAVVLARIAACMERPGGVFFFRDYAAEDQAQKRFRSRTTTRRGAPAHSSTATAEEGTEEPSSVDDSGNTYTRTNGTLSHFFTIEEVRALFVGAGFEVIDLRLVEVEVTNRKKGLCFDRKFLQGRFRLNSV